MSIITSFQESIMGWKMFFGGDSVGMQNSAQAQKTELGGFSAPIKAGGVPVVSAEAQAPVDVKYIPASGGYPLHTSPNGGGRVGAVALQATEDPGTPATVIERIQKSIGESAEGWRMGFASVVGKAQTLSGKISDKMLKTQTGVEKSVAGVGEWFGNLGEGMSSFKWLVYIAVAVLIFVGVMVSIGYSGVGAPVARIAEKEHARRR